MANNTASKTISKTSDFPNRLAQLQKSNPQIFKNAAQITKKNYK
jgi:hypothetical protein